MREEGVGSGMALSGDVSDGDMPCVSDILEVVKCVQCVNRERESKSGFFLDKGEEQSYDSFM